jgi:hypothetical protein
MVKRNLPEWVTFPMQVPRLTRLSLAICTVRKNRNQMSWSGNVHAAICNTARTERMVVTCTP